MAIIRIKSRHGPETLGFGVELRELKRGWISQFREYRVLWIPSRLCRAHRRFQFRLLRNTKESGRWVQYGLGISCADLEIIERILRAGAIVRNLGS